MIGPGVGTDRRAAGIGVDDGLGGRDPTMGAGFGSAGGARGDREGGDGAVRERVRDAPERHGRDREQRHAPAGEAGSCDRPASRRRPHSILTSNPEVLVSTACPAEGPNRSRNTAPADPLSAQAWPARRPNAGGSCQLLGSHRLTSEAVCKP
jgi:hypothetical protein